MKRFTSIKWGSEAMGSPRLAVMGKIKIGGKGEKREKKGGGGTYRLPKKFDHFVITSRARGTDDNFVPDLKLMKKLQTDGKPRKIPVILQYDDPELNFPHRLACYDSRTLYCSGNGEVARRRTDGDFKSIDCPCDLLREAKDGKRCKPSGTLLVVLPTAPRVGAVYEFKTSAWETTRNLISSMQHLLRLTGGLLAGIPLCLELYAATDTYQADGKTKTNTNWKVALIFDGTYEQMAALVQSTAQVRLAAQVDMKALESGVRPLIEAEESEVVHGNFVDEFHPTGVQDDEESMEGEGEGEEAPDDPADDEEFLLCANVRELAESLGRKNIDQMISDQYMHAKCDGADPKTYLTILYDSLNAEATGKTMPLPLDKDKVEVPESDVEVE